MVQLVERPAAAGESVLAEAIGQRVRQHRASRNLTLDQLAATAGVSRRLLVSVEHGDANPSIGTLLKISQALAIPLPALVDAPAHEPLRVVRAGGGSRLWQGPKGGSGVLLVAADTADALELWEWVMEPGESYASVAHTPGTRESLHVHQGSVRVTVGSVDAVLKRGDAITFAGDQPHSYSHASGTGATRFSMSVYEPAAASVPAKRSLS